MKITAIGINLAKSVFPVHGVNEHGRAVLRKVLRRDQMLPSFALVATKRSSGEHR